MNPSGILCLGTTPAVQRVMLFRTLKLDAVNRSATTLDGAAGKAVNVAKVLKALGEQPLVTGFLGGARGDFLRTVLAENGVASDFVAVKAPTRQCITVIDESAGTQTELVEESRPVGPADFDALMAVVRRQIPRCRAMVMSGTIVTGGPTTLYRDCLRLAAASVLSVVDAQGAALLEALKEKPGLVKPNRLELAATTKRELKSEADLRSAMRELHERGAQRVMVTAGTEPTMAFDGNVFWQVITPRIRAVNSIGCGDAFAAAATWRLLRGDDLGEACRWSAATGAADALTAMVGEVSRADVDRLAREVEVRRI